MTLHALQQYLRYRWTAKTRHGVHSPFVYKLTDEVLRRPQGPLAAALVNYFGCRQVHFVTDGNTPTPPFTQAAKDMQVHTVQLLATIGSLPQADMVWVAAPPVHWQQILDAYKDHLHAGSCMVFTHIHRTAAASAMWQQLYNDPSVQLSIDLYRYGLVFFKPEFKEKQHFVLRYKG